MCETYNGWTNRETWAVALYINNDQSWYAGVIDALLEAVGEVVIGENGYEERDVPLKAWEAGVIVKENVERVVTVDGYEEMTGETQLPASLSRIAEDIGSLYRVDWDAVGASFLSDLV